MDRQGTVCCAWEKTAFEEGLKAGIPCAVRRALIFSPLVAFGVSAVAASARTSCASSKFVSFFMSCLHVGYFAVFCRKGKLPVRSSNFFVKPT